MEVVYVAPVDAYRIVNVRIVFVETQFVIASNDNLMLMWQRVEPVYRSLQLFDGAIVCQVACVDQKVSIRYFDIVVFVMSV